MPEVHAAPGQHLLPAGNFLQTGEPVHFQRPPVRVPLLLLLALLLAALYLSFTTGFKASIRARGVLIPEQGLVSVYPDRHGLVERTQLQSGDRVEAGETVAFINSASGLAGAGTAGTGMTGIERQRRTLLEHKMESLRALQEIQQRQATERLFLLQAAEASLHETIALGTEASSLFQKRLSLSSQQTSAGRELFLSDNISASDYQRALEDHFTLQEHGQSLGKALLESRFRLAENLSQQHALPLEASEQALRLEMEIAAIALQLQELDHTQRQAVLAPVAGTLDNFHIANGDRAAPEAMLFSILPASGTLEAHLYVPASAIASVHTGQEILISHDAFDYQRFGFFKAHVTHIANIVSDPRSAPFPVAVNEPVYLVKARLEEDGTEASPQLALRAGMSFTAELVTTEKPIAAYVLEPFLRLLEK